MAGYSDTRQLIIDTLMGRPTGTEIQPKDHQAFALALNDYIRSVELVAGSGVPVDFAEPDTVPVQPNNGQATYLSYVPRSTTKSFVNFINQSGDSISITSSEEEVKLVTLLWNGSYWSSQIVTISVLSDDSSVNTSNIGASDYILFSASSNYSIGDIVSYDGKLYKFTSDHAAGNWLGTDVELASINSILTDKLTELESHINKINNDIVDFEDAVRQQVEKYKPIIINGDVTNAADEEDITSENGLLKFKNRAALNGMGYVILRKDKTFIEQVEGIKNTIFEVRYDFDFGNVAEDKGITIGEGVRFIFNGGSVRYDGVVFGKENYVYARNIGMIPNNDSDITASFNYKKITQVLNMGFRLIVDDVYYVLTIDETRVNNLDISGIDKHTAKLIFKSNQGLKVSNTIEYVSINNISIDTLGAKGNVYGNSFILIDAAPKKLKEVICNNIHIEGLRLLQIESVDISMNDWELHNVSIRNVEAKNISSLVVLDDIPVKTFICEHCTFTDFFHAVIKIATNNSYVNKSALYVENVYIKNNIAECTQVFNHEVTYQCLSLVEAKQVYYLNNIVRNIVNTNSKSVIYDSYSNCDVLYYCNNIVENICSLNNQYRDIYKNKMGSGGGVYRYIFNNSYKLSKKFFEDNNLLSEDYDWGNSLGNSQGLFEEFYFINNKVVCEFGKLSFGNFITSKHVVVKDNYIRGYIDISFGTALIFIMEGQNIDITGNSFINESKELVSPPKLFRTDIIPSNFSMCYKNNYLKNVLFFMKPEANNTTPEQYSAFKHSIISDSNYLYLDCKLDEPYYEYIGNNSTIDCERSLFFNSFNFYEDYNVKIKGHLHSNIDMNRFVQASDFRNVLFTTDGINTFAKKIDDGSFDIYTKRELLNTKNTQTSWYGILMDEVASKLLSIKDKTIQFSNVTIDVKINVYTPLSHIIRPTDCSSEYLKKLQPNYGVIQGWSGVPVVFNTTLKKPIYWTKEGRWVDANGTDVVL